MHPLLAQRPLVAYVAYSLEVSPGIARSSLFVGLIAIWIGSSIPSTASTATLYWDTNGTTAGAGAMPTGTWGDDSFWNTDSTGGNGGTLGSYIAGSDVVFSADGTTVGSSANPFTVTVSGQQTVNSLTFGAVGGTTAMATITGDGITLNTAAITANVNGEIDSVLNGNLGLTKNGKPRLSSSEESIITPARRPSMPERFDSQPAIRCLPTLA